MQIKKPVEAQRQRTRVTVAVTIEYLEEIGREPTRISYDSHRDAVLLSGTPASSTITGFIRKLCLLVREASFYLKPSGQ